MFFIQDMEIKKWIIYSAIHKVTANGSRLGEVGDLEAQSLNFSTNFK